MPRNEDLYEAICKGDAKAVQDLVQAVIDADDDVVGLLNETMIPAMRNVGELFSKNEIFVPEMLIAARAMQAGLKLIEPRLIDSGHQPRAGRRGYRQRRFA